MVGLFINTLPVRVRGGRRRAAGPLAGAACRSAGRDAPVRATRPLTQVQGWSEVPRGLPLFESLLVFENYPVDSSLGKSAGGVEIRGLRTFQRTNYPLAFVAVPGEILSLRLGYDRRRFDRGGDRPPRRTPRGAPRGARGAPRTARQPADALCRGALSIALRMEGEDAEGAGSRCVHRLFEALGGEHAGGSGSRVRGSWSSATASSTGGPTGLPIACATWGSGPRCWSASAPAARPR